MFLTDLKVRNTKPKAAPYRISDGAGLYIWVTPAGGRLWRWKYRHAGKEKLMSFGSYPDVLIAKARQCHLEGRRLLSEGIDPMEERKTAKNAERVASETSFATVAAQWLEHWKHSVSLRHFETTRRRLETNVLPSLGDRPVNEIEAPEICAIVKDIESRGASDIAKRAMETIGQIFRYAIAHGHTRRNPATEIKPRDILRATRKTNYARLDAKELPELLRKIELYPGKHVTRLAMKLMALIFVRTAELIGATWSEFDLANARWDIPAERMKMRSPHVVPLSRQSLKILSQLQELTGSGLWLFPGDLSTEKHMSNNTILKGLERIGYKGRMTGHGFRGIASTVLHEQGYPHDHIELQLAHSPRNAVSAAYNHALHLKARTKMMQDWADFLERIQSGAKLLQFERRG